ncbi:MAG: hypothetical protein AAFU85_18295, partial [Planctomycetota bacterium]
QQQRRVLQYLGSELVQRLAVSPDVGAQSIESQEVIRMLACASLLDEDTQAQASKSLHEILSDQLRRRGKLTAAFSHKAVVEIPVLLPAMTLVSLDGELPRELASATESEAVSKELQAVREKLFDETSRLRLRACQSLYPLRTGIMVLEACSERLRQADRTGEFESEDYSAVSRLLLEWDESFLLAIFESADSDPDLIPAIQVVLENLRSKIDSPTDLQLSVPLRSFAEQMLRISRQDAFADQRGMALRLAQLGDADAEDVYLIAMSHVIQTQGTEDKKRWSTTQVEFGWLLECLAQEELRGRVDSDMYQQMVDRLMTERFSVRATTSLNRCFVSILAIREKQSLPDGVDGLIRLALGSRSSRYFGWPGSRELEAGREWQLIAMNVPAKIIEAGLRSVIAKPPQDVELLRELESKLSRMKQMGLRGIATRLLDEAVETMEESVAAL